MNAAILVSRERMMSLLLPSRAAAALLSRVERRQSQI